MPRYPRTLERDYRRALRRRVRAVERATRFALDKWLELGARDAMNERSRTDSASSDADRAQRIIRRVRTAYDEAYTTREDLELASQTFERADGYTYRGIKREHVRALGVEPLVNSSTKKLAEDFVAENVALIKDLPTKQLADIEKDVLEAIQNGERAEAISRIIRERSGMARRRADLIARDQMGKAVSQLNQKRMQELGFDKYIWRTVGDERVRPEHDDRDGVTFSWSNPPEDGHPGEPINCRCSAEPVFADVLDELGVEYDPSDFNQRDPDEWNLKRAAEAASQAGTIREAKSLFQKAKESAKSPEALEARLAEIADLDEPTEFDLRNPRPTAHEIANALDRPNAPPKAREAARLLRNRRVEVKYLKNNEYERVARALGVSPEDRAFTDGHTIYIPEHTKGKITLVAHEMSHVVDIQLGLGYSLQEEETAAWLFESDVRRLYGQEAIVTTREEALEIYRALYDDE